MARILGILASTLALMFAIATTVVGGASASTGGHFVFPDSGALVSGEDTISHRVHLFADGSWITCNHSTYAGLGTGTVTQLKMEAAYKKCELKTLDDTTVTMNGCYYLFTIGSDATKDNTTHLKCPDNNYVEVHAPGCTLSFDPQTPAGGVAYNTVISNEKHAITAVITLTAITYTRHSGACSFLGTTSHNAFMTGEVLLRGREVEGLDYLDITATGSSGA